MRGDGGVATNIVQRAMGENGNELRWDVPGGKGVGEGGKQRVPLSRTDVPYSVAVYA